MNEQVPEVVRRMGAPLFALPPGSKSPYRGTDRHGHKDAVSFEQLHLEPNENYGIALDGYLLVVDFDREDTEGFADRLPPTLVVRTRRGSHWYYRVPPGYRGSNRKFAAGDIKCNGYTVGPGSVVEGRTYLVEIGKEGPADAPEWLLDYCAARAEVPELSSGGIESDCIPDGGRDNALASIAGSMRKYGLSESAIRAHLWSLVENGLVEQPEGREVTYADCRRIARSISHKDPETILGPIDSASLVWLPEAIQIKKPTDWWIYGFVPKGELVLVYGEGGIGKSSFAAWVACQVASKGGKTLVISMEEPFDRFAWRCYLSNIAVPESVGSLGNPAAFMTPNTVERLEEIIRESGIDLVYIDSIYSHFGGVAGMNAAERSRYCLGPLANLAIATGTTILGTFHENKSGQYLGSTEMKNVPRIVLHATRKQIDGSPLIVRVEKTNFVDPDYALSFTGEKLPMVNRETGEVQLEIKRDGSTGPQEIIIAKQSEDISTDIALANEIDINEIEEGPRDWVFRKLSSGSELSWQEAQMQFPNLKPKTLTNIIYEMRKLLRETS